MGIFENIKNFFRQKNKKMIGSGEKGDTGEQESSTAQGRTNFKRKIQESAVSNSDNNCIYNILKYYKLPERFARSYIVQEAIRTIIVDKVYSKYGHNSINLLSMEEILELLEGDVTVKTNEIAIRNTSLNEESEQISFVNVSQLRKGIRVIEEEVIKYGTFSEKIKKSKEYNKYNVLMKRVEETENRYKYDADRNTHNRITIERSEDNPFVITHESEDIIEGTRLEGTFFYADIDSCLDLEDCVIYENVYKFTNKDKDISDFYIKSMIGEMQSTTRSGAREFLAFSRKEYSTIFHDDNQTAKINDVVK